MSVISSWRLCIAVVALLSFSAAFRPLNALAQEGNISPETAALLNQAAQKEDGFAELRQQYRCIFKNTKFTTHTVWLYESFYVNGYEVQRLLTVNDLALTQDQEQQERARVDAEITADKQKPSPAFVGLAGGMIFSKGAHQWSQTVEGAIMRASIFSNDRLVMYHNRKAIQVDFVGNRKFKAQTDEERAAKALSGTIILDKETGAVLRVGAEAVVEVSRHGWPLIMPGAHIGFDATKIDEALSYPRHG